MTHNFKLLIVCSVNSGRIASFISDQVEALKNAGITCDYFTIGSKGIKGYLAHRYKLLNKISSFKPDIIHAHYGLSGLLANTQRKIPVITTYHGSDINVSKVFFFSRLNMLMSAYNIFVSEKNLLKSKLKCNFALIPCGVDTTLFFPIEKIIARNQLGIDIKKKIVLFAGDFNNPVKNPTLAIAAVNNLINTELIELKGYTRKEVALLMNAVDVCLLTSLSEGSPQFIKEAMACNCPVVSVNVGDVESVIKDISGCYIAESNVAEISEKITYALSFASKTNGREKIISMQLNQESVVKKLIETYSYILKSVK